MGYEDGKQDREASKLPVAQAQYLNDYIDRNRYSKAQIASDMRIDPSSLSRILNRTAGIGFDKYMGLLAVLGLRAEIVPDGQPDEFAQLGESIRRNLFDWSAIVEGLRKQYGAVDDRARVKGEQLARGQLGQTQPGRRPAPRRRKRAGGAEGS